MTDTKFWQHLDQMVEDGEIIIDRAKNSQHPNYDTMIYPLDYGYLAGTTSSDGAGIDVWVGSLKTKDVQAIICTVDLLKRDTEVKILIGCTEEEMEIIAKFMNQGDMQGLLVKR